MGFGRRNSSALPRIREFSELGDQFSSPCEPTLGDERAPRVRLATAVRPDVLIIDEALAVETRISSRVLPESANCGTGHLALFAHDGDHSWRERSS
jgi:hypothetical protein